jgi:putative ABC transport system permease protein
MARTTLTVIGIALGVGVILAINLANGAALHQFREGVDIVAGKANLEIRAVNAPDIDERQISKLAALRREGVRYAPVIDQIGIIRSPSSPEIVQVLGVDMFGDADFRSMSLTPVPSDEKLGDLAIFDRNRIYAGEKLAKHYSLKVGETFPLVLSDKEQNTVVAGILEFSGPGKAFGGNIVAMDISAAQDAFGMQGRLSRIDLIVPEDSLPLCKQKIADMMPPGVVVDAPQRRSEQIEKMVRAFQYNLAALSLIAVVVGMFVIYNTMSIAVIRRRPEIGTMRVLGLPRSTIFALFLSEAVFLGSVGSLLGIGLGIAGANFALKAVSRTVQSLYVDQPPAELVIDPVAVGIAFAGGLFMTAVAALAPALEASTVSAAEASRRGAYETRVRGSLAFLGAFGLALGLVAFICGKQPAVNGFPLFGYGSAALSVFAVAFLMPVILRWFLKMLAAVLQKCGANLPRLAALSLYGTLGRTSVAVSSLMVGIAMMVSLAVMIGSFRETVIAWTHQSLVADLFIEPVARRYSNRAGALSHDVVEKIRKVPGVSDVDAFVEFPIEYEGEPTNLGAGEMDVMARKGNLMFLDGEKSSVVLERMRAEHGAVVTESFAMRHNLRKGDRIKLSTPRGEITYPVEGIYYDYVSDRGYVIIDRDEFARHYDDRYSTTVAVWTDPNLDVEGVRANIYKAIGTDSLLNIRTNKELKKSVLRVFDNTFAITYALHAIAITVAILGVMNALFALTLEMRRDFGILKYLGTSAGHLRRIVLSQAAILGVCGAVSGLVVGMGLSMLLIDVINKQSFGWTIQFAVPTDFLLQSFLLIVACSVLSGLLPAQVAASTPAPEVVRNE